MKRHYAVLCVTLAVSALSLPAKAEEPAIVVPPPASSSVITLMPGQSRILRFPTINRAAIGNPAVADIAVLSPSELLLNAKSSGGTLLYVRNSKGAASISVKVGAPEAPVAPDVSQEINTALAGTGVTAVMSGKAVVLKGIVDTPEDETRAVAVAKAFTPNVASLITVNSDAATTMARTLTDALKPMGVTARPAGGNTVVLEGGTTPENSEVVAKIATQLATGFQIVNLVTDNVVGRQVVVHARIVAADQTALRELGIDWGRVIVDDKDRAVGVEQPIVFGESRTSNPPVNGGGPLRRLNAIGATLQALEQGNRAKTLSSPDVLVQDNHKAQIVVGGEIPVPVPQLGAGASTITVQYKQYGVQLTVTPRILADGSVSMHVLPEVSTVDQANAVFLAGFRIPAFFVRRAETDVTVKSGETLVIGGLLQDQDIDIIRKIPVLADIPLLGELFKFRSKSRVRTQLIILVTPEVLEPGARPAVPELANLKSDPVVLPPASSVFQPGRTEPPTMPGLPSPGRTPIPMQRERQRVGANPGLSLN